MKIKVLCQLIVALVATSILVGCSSPGKKAKVPVTSPKASVQAAPAPVPQSAVLAPVAPVKSNLCIQVVAPGAPKVADPTMVRPPIIIGRGGSGNNSALFINQYGTSDVTILLNNGQDGRFALADKENQEVQVEPGTEALAFLIITTNSYFAGEVKFSTGRYQQIWIVDPKKPKTAGTP